MTTWDDCTQCEADGNKLCNHSVDNHNFQYCCTSGETGSGCDNCQTSTINVQSQLKCQTEQSQCGTFQEVSPKISGKTKVGSDSIDPEMRCNYDITPAFEDSSEDETMYIEWRSGNSDMRVNVYKFV